MNKDFLLALLLFLITFVSRSVFFEQDFGGFSYDSGSFALAVQSYDISQTRPHLPGYYLHVQSIKLLRSLTGDTHSAMKLLTLLYVSLAAAILYLVLRRWFGRALSLLLYALIFSNPLVWFFGCVTEIYAFDLFFGIALLALGVSPRAIYATPFFMGFFSGVRPSSAVLLLPFYILLWYGHFKAHKPSVPRVVVSHLIGIAGALLWLIPMIHSAGGLSQYLSLYSTNYPVEKISLLQNWYRFTSYFVFLIIPYLVLLVYKIVQKYFRKNSSGQQGLSWVQNIPGEFTSLMLWWLIPPLLFFIFFHYSKGYFLLCAIPFFGLTLHIIKNEVIAIRILLLAAIIQIIIFVAVPYSQPDVQTYFSPQVRRIGLAKVWWERTNSVLLMAQSHIRAKEKSAALLGEVLDSGLKSELLNGADKKYLFIDPTFPVKARSLQVKYPKLLFTQLGFRKKDGYELFTGLSDVSYTGLSKMIRQACLISRSDFVEKYLKDIEITKIYSNRYTVFTVGPAESPVVAARYDSLFFRGK